jgi:hypothetical protein
VFGVTGITTAYGSIAMFLIRSTILVHLAGRIARCWDLSCVADKDRLPRPQFPISGVLCVTPHPIKECCQSSAAQLLL